MKRKTYNLLRKNFRTVDHRGLPNRDDPSYRALQNILNGVNYLRNKSIVSIVVTRIGNDNR